MDPGAGRSIVVNCSAFCEFCLQMAGDVSPAYRGTESAHSLDELRSIVQQPSWYSLRSRALELLAFAREIHRTTPRGFLPGDRVGCHDFYLLGPRPLPTLAPSSVKPEAQPVAESEAKATSTVVKAEPLVKEGPKGPPPRPPTDPEPVAKKAKAEAKAGPPPAKAAAPAPPVQSLQVPAKPAKPSPSSSPYPGIIPPPPPVVKAQAPAVMPPPAPPAKGKASGNRARGVRGGQNLAYYAKLYAGFRKGWQDHGW